MIKTTIICLSLVTCLGCATAVDLVVQSVSGIIGGAVGNMVDRRIEKKLEGEKKEVKDKKVVKYNMTDDLLNLDNKPNDNVKEKDNECKDCENDKL